MDLLEAREVMLDLLAEKLNLTQGHTLFSGGLPPGATEGVWLDMTGIRSWPPDGAMECEAVISGAFESEKTFMEHLAKLRDLLQNSPCRAFLSWQLAGAIRIGNQPGDAMDRHTFQIPVILAFV